jgi:hypothetical protein
MAAIKPGHAVTTTVIARLDRAIHAIRSGTIATPAARRHHGMDGRIKCGHDGGELARLAHVPAVGWISAFAGMSGEGSVANDPGFRLEFIRGPTEGRTRGPE